jgi:hypothetical protein
MARRRSLIPVLLTFAALAITGCGDSGDSNGSTAREKVVPGVTGKPVAEARAAITDAGLERFAISSEILRERCRRAT